jgi:hypothetical protein
MSVSFWTGHPDNGSGGLYFEIQREVDADWLTVATEADWSTKGMWTQASRVIPPYDPLDPFAEPPPPINEAFTVAISWDIPDDVEPGTYRVVFYGTEKPQETGTATAFTTESPALEITP